MNAHENARRPVAGVVVRALTGWSNIIEAERYTQKADRWRLAGGAVSLLRPEGFGGGRAGPPARWADGESGDRARPLLCI